MLKQSLRLAFAAALQRLAPKQRASLLLTEVLGFSAAETADTLGTSLASVNSALQRARATLPTPAPADSPELSEQQESLLERYVDAFERYDVSSLTRLMRETSPSACRPIGSGSGTRGGRALDARPRRRVRRLPFLPHRRVRPAPLAQWRRDPAGGHKAWALIVLELAGNGVAGVNNFLDVDRLFPGFGLPLRLAPGSPIEPVAPPQRLLDGS